MLSEQQKKSAVEYNKARDYSVSAWQLIQQITGSVQDGSPGPATAQAIAHHQDGLSLAPDGKCGAGTIAAFDDADLRCRLLTSRDDRQPFADIIKAYPDRPLLIDVSQHQSDIDWQAVKRAGVAGAIIKASEGRGHVDPRWVENWQGAQDAGMKRGAYQYCILAWKGERADVKPQIDNLRNRIDCDVGDLRPALDYEYPEVEKLIDLIGVNGAVEWMIEASDYFKECFGFTPLLYWSPRTIRLLGEPEALKDHHHWTTGYPTMPFPLSQRIEPYKHVEGWGWAQWQFSCRVRVAGINSDVDCNLCNGPISGLEV